MSEVQEADTIVEMLLSKHHLVEPDKSMVKKAILSLVLEHGANISDVVIDDIVKANEYFNKRSSR